MKHRIVVTCGRGVPPLLAREITALGLPVVAEELSAVATEGTLYDAMRLNLHLRTAHRVLLSLTGFRAEQPDDVYARAVGLPWEEYLHPDGYFSVGAAVHNVPVRDTRFPALRLKDAVVDRMRKATGRRPDSGSEPRGAAVFLHWEGRRAEIYLDTTGESLSHRGYRVEPWKAPMRETLAAACLLAAEWDPGTVLVNPMCGSGTVAVEAAWMAGHRAPGLLRKDFAFRHVRGFRERDWKDLRAAAEAAVTPVHATWIVATDHHPQAIEAARRNAERAGVGPAIDWQVVDFRETPVPPAPGLVFLNPEYGERLGDESELEPVYRGIGDFLKQRCRGYQGAVLTGSLPLSRKIGLRSRRRVSIWNGPLECRLLLFDLYEGSRYQRPGRGADADDPASPPPGGGVTAGGNDRPAPGSAWTGPAPAPVPND